MGCVQQLVVIMETCSHRISQSSSTVRTELIDKVNGVQNQLTSTADSLSLKITNLKIGARNLLP